jgi:NADH-quinone oxidoreductase subunit J
MSTVPLNPGLLFVLCVAAAIGTIMALPNRQEASIRKIGGIVLLAAGLILMATLVRYLAGPAGAERGGMGPYFWIFSGIALISAIRVITHPRPVYSALYFVLSVLAAAGLFILLSAEFMAAALVLIYAGAILVTYVFVIMLATQSGASEDEATMPETDTVSREPVIAAAIGFALAGVLLYVIFDQAPLMNPVETGIPVRGYTEALGRYLFQSPVLSLEVAGLILTLAMVGAIVIAGRRIVGAVGHEPMHAATPMTPIDDNPHSIPVIGNDNPRLKAYPET